ncbi:MAG: GAF domain-containing protein [Chloroflexi bacterium]|nr:GAF domain-containing protein [Chloroflexota bacterium]
MLRRLSIQAQFIIFIVAALVLLFAALMVVFSFQGQADLVDGENDRSLTLANSLIGPLQVGSQTYGALGNVPGVDERLTDLVVNSVDGEIDFVTVTWPDGTVLYHSDPSYNGQMIEALANPEDSDSHRASVSGFGTVYLSSLELDNPVAATASEPDTFYITVGADAGALDQRLIDGLLVSIVIAAGAIVVVAALTVWLVRVSLTRPIQRIVDGARLFSVGQLDHQIEPGGSDVLRQLAETLNQMADDIVESRIELEAMNRTLEDRIQARTADLATVAEVSAETATVLDIDQLLLYVSNLTKERFGLYHAHVFVLDEEQNLLELAAGAGEAGERMAAAGLRIRYDNQGSLVARAARSRLPVVENEVRRASDFLPNPLLPNTASEAAFPLVVGDRVVGVLDVQSDQVDFFTDDQLTVLNTLARQIAVSVANARLFTEVERTSRHEQALSAITEQIQRATTMDEVLQTAARELGRALRVPHTTVQLQLRQTLDAQMLDGDETRTAAHSPAIETATEFGSAAN